MRRTPSPRLLANTPHPANIATGGIHAHDRFAMDDARRKHQAIVDLIAAGDGQAIGSATLHRARRGRAFQRGGRTAVAGCCRTEAHFGRTDRLWAHDRAGGVGHSGRALAFQHSTCRARARVLGMGRAEPGLDGPDAAGLSSADGEDIAINRGTNARMGREMLLASALAPWLL